MILRTLCIGIGQSYDTSYNYASGKNRIPTLFDYDTVILDTSIIYKNKTLFSKTYFERFFKNNGMCFTLCTPRKTFSSSGRISNNYDWFPLNNELEIKDVNGKSVVCVFEDAEWLFDSISFQWSCYFSKIPDNSVILATNRVGDIISFVVPYETGYCVFLPYTSQKNKLINIIDD